MSTRYTKRDAEAAFKRLCDALGKQQQDWTLSMSDPAREGRWSLDHNSVYGGYVVVESVAGTPRDDGSQQYSAEDCPLGHTRRNAREFVEFVSTYLAGHSAASTTGSR